MRRWFQGLAACVVVSLVGCATSGPLARHDGPPRQPRDVSGVTDAVPKAEPLSELGNHSPYVVLGKTYRILPNASGYQATGLASWYGTKFQGRPTSSGQPYDMYQMTAAHRTLPIPSYVEVKNLDNGRAVVVKVNDRGPFREDRIIDLSWAAAVRLGFVHKGVARVRLAVIDPSPPARVPPAHARPVAQVSAPAPGSEGHGLAGERLFLQAGAFSNATAAATFSDALRRVVGDRVRIVRFPAQDGLHRVRVGPLDDMQEATRLQERIINSDLGVPLIVHD